MTVYFVLALILGIGLILAVVSGQRARTAEDVLSQPASNRAVATGANSDFRSLIELNVQARATGILTARSGGETCSVAFLFGHVFHASCGTVEGEEAVRTALRWTSPELSFDRKAQLPAKETITQPIASILDEA